jgi:hypothetical protein
MKMSSLLAKDTFHCAIGNSLVGLSIQRDSNRKASWFVVSSDLNAGDGFTTGPLLHGLKAFFA